MKQKPSAFQSCLKIRPHPMLFSAAFSILLFIDVTKGVIEIIMTSCCCFLNLIETLTYFQMAAQCLMIIQRAFEYHAASFTIKPFCLCWSHYLTAHACSYLYCQLLLSNALLTVQLFTMPKV